MSTTLYGPRSGKQLRGRTGVSRVFSYPVMLCSLLVTLTVLTVKGRLCDPDLWWHLRLGRDMWEHHVLPTMDVLSYTTHRSPFIAHEWLSEVVIYGSYHLAGLRGVMGWFAAMMSLIVVGVYLVGWLYSGDVKTAFGSALAAWFFATVGAGPRPHLLGYLLLVGELGIVELCRTRDRRYSVLLPPLFLVWINCHGSWMLGLLVASLAWLCSLTTLRSRVFETEPWPDASRRYLGFALLAVPPVLLINPVGIRLLAYPFNLIFRQHTNLAEIPEWQALQFSDPRAYGVLIVVLVSCVLPVLRGRRIALFDVILLAMGTVSACQHVRLLFVFGILSAPLLAKALAGLFGEYRLERDLPAANGALMLLAALIVAAAFPTESTLKAEVITGSPVRAVDFIRAHQLPGPILNEYEYGGYLTWAAPEYPTFIDGRADVFDWSGVFDQAARWAHLDEDPRLLPDRYGVNLCILKRDSKAGRMLELLGGWQRVYQDGNAIVLRRVHTLGVPRQDATAPSSTPRTTPAGHL